VITRACLIAVGILLLCAPGASAQTPEFFNVPAPLNAGAGIAPANDGTVWFGANPAGSPAPTLGRLTVSQAVPGTANGMATYPTPTHAGTSCCANQIRSVAVDGANNRVWFVQSDGIVGWADPTAVAPGTSNGMSSVLHSTALTGGGSFASDLWDIAIGTGGLAWFTERSTTNVAPYPGARISSINSTLGVTESENIALQGGASTLNSLRYDSKPAGITTDSNGVPWFAESDPGNPGYRIARANGSGYAEYLIQPCGPGSPCSGSYTGTGPTDVAVAHDGTIWFTNQLKNEVGRLDPTGGTFTNYSLPAIDAGLTGGQARAISVAQDGTLWVAQYGGYSYASANAIIRIVPSFPTPTATVFPLGAGKFPLAVAPDTAGNVWFAVATSTAPGQIGRLAGVVGGAIPPGGGGGGGGGSTPPPGDIKVKPASVGVAKIGTPSTDGTKLTVDQICVGPPADPCTLVYILSAREYVTGFPGTKAGASAVAAAKKGKKKGKAKPKPVILGQKTVTLKGGQRKKVTVELNAKGRKLLNQKGKLTLYFSATQKGAPGKPAKRVKAVKVTFKKAKAKPKRK
jgi:hypothetical protein